jgi:uncharacterized membrane protein
VEKSKSTSIAVIGLVSGLLSTVANAVGTTFTPIDFPNATATHALGINSDGDIVGRYDSADGKTHGYLLERSGQFITLDFRRPFSTRRAIFTVAAAINSHGVIVGQYRLSTDDTRARHGFKRTRRGTFIKIDYPNAAFTNALGINDRGEIVGRYCTVLPCLPAYQHGFRRSSIGLFSRINVTGAAGTAAWGINNGRKIVGGYQDSNGKSHVYLRHHNQFTPIDFPTAVDPNAVDTAPFVAKGGINSSDDIASYYCNLEPCVVNNNMLKLDNDSEHGFLRSHAGAFTRIDVPNSHATQAFGINDRGDIVGTYHDAASGKDRGFLLK